MDGDQQGHQGLYEDEGAAMKPVQAPQPPIEIRAARAEDADAIAVLYLASRRTHVAFAPLAHPDEAVRRWITQHVVPSGRVLVAMAEGRVIGFCGSSVEHAEPGDSSADRARGWIDQLYLAPDRVGQGTGSALLAAALATLPRPVRLYTFAQNTGARRFYERHGFVAVEFGDGSGNEEGCADVLYERTTEAWCEGTSRQCSPTPACHARSSR